MPIVVYSMMALLVLLVGFAILRRVRRDYLQHGKLTPYSAFLQFAACVLCALLLNLGLIGTDWPRLHVRGLLLVLGALIAVLGTGVLFAALGVFASFRRMVGREVNVLKRSGVYRWSRNPQLVGGGLIIVAFLLLWPSWHIAVSLLVYAVFGHLMVLTEEEHLRRVYGEEYEAYCARTPRYAGLPKHKS